MRLIFENNHTPEVGRFKDAVVQDPQQDKLWFYDVAGTVVSLNTAGRGIVTYDELADFPATGLANTLYVALDSGIIYYWDGNSYEFAGSGSGVTSVNGDTGVVVLTQDDIADGSTYKQYSQTDKTKLAGIETGADVTDAGNVGAAIHGATGKTTPVDADTVGLIDSAASNVLKKVTWANIKATLKAYFDTLYAAISHTHAQSDVTDLTTDLAGKQPLDSDLTTVAGLTPSNDDVLQRKAGAWVNRTPAQLKTDLSLVKGDVGLGNVDNTSDATKNAAAVTLTNKGIDADANTITNLEVGDFKASAIVTEAEGLASSDNDTSLPTTAAVRDYVDDAVAAGVADGDKGDVTVSSSGSVWTIDNDAVSYAKMQDVSATARLLGRVTAGSGIVEEVVIDTDLSSVSGSDDTIPSAKAVKTALDAKAPLASPTFTGTVTLPTGLTGVLRADSGVVSVDSDVTDLVGAASDSAAGKVELATAAETTTGTDAGRAITPDGLAGSDYGKRVIGILVSDPQGSAITTGDGKAVARIPSVLNGYNLIAVAASVSTVSSSGIPTVQLRRSRRTNATTRADADMLSTKLTVDASEFDSSDAAAAAVIDASNDDVATGDYIFVDIDVAGTGAKGLYVELIFQLP